MFNKLTKQERRHLRESGVFTLDQFANTRRQQIESLTRDIIAKGDYHPGSMEPCYMCKMIARKLGLETPEFQQQIITNALVAVTHSKSVTEHTIQAILDIKGGTTMKQKASMTTLESRVLRGLIGQSAARSVGKMHVTRAVIAENPNAMAGAISTLQRKGFVATGHTRSGNKSVSITRLGFDTYQDYSHLQGC